MHTGVLTDRYHPPVAGGGDPGLRDLAAGLTVPGAGVTLLPGEGGGRGGTSCLRRGVSEHSRAHEAASTGEGGR